MKKTTLDLTNLSWGRSNSPKFNNRFDAYQADGYILNIDYVIDSVSVKGNWKRFLCITTDGQRFDVTYRMFPNGTLQTKGFINEMK